MNAINTTPLQTDLESTSTAAHEWIQDANDNDRWYKNKHQKEYGHIAHLSDTHKFCWQAARHGHRLTGIAADIEEAMRKADEKLALPIEEFNNLVATELLEELNKLERQILELKPAPKLLAGYHAGYEDGIAETTAKIAKALNLSDGPL